MKKQLLIVAAFLLATNAFSAVVKDTASYASTSLYTFENLWIQSRYSVPVSYPSIGFGLATGSAVGNDIRGMAGKDGKIIFCFRDAVIATGIEKYMRKSKILVYDGLNGDLVNTIPVPDSLFHQKDAVGDTLRAIGYPSNDIQVDNAGNIILANLTLNLATSPFVVAALKLDLNAGTVLSAKRVMKEMFPLAATARIDAFNVYGDLLTNGYFMAPISLALAGLSNFVYRWDVKAGVTNIDYKEIEIKKYVPVTAKFNSTAPRVKPISETLFYLDGQDSYATLYDMDGNLVDSIPKAFYPASPGNNGVDEFVIGTHNFVVYSHANTATVPNSSWAVAELGAGQSLMNMSRLYIFPKGGMGNTSNPVRTAVPYIEVVGSSAYIYVYGFANGLAAYKLTLKATGLDKNAMSNVTITLNGSQIRISDEVALAEVYSVTGQRIASVKNVSRLEAPTANGIYIVKVIDRYGAKKIQKIAVN